MKYFIYCIAFISFFSSSKLVAQTNSSHPTVSNLTVQYKPLPQHTLSVSQATNNSVKVIPMATISLIDASLVSMVDFKVVNNTGAIEYQANYNLSSNAISDASGRKVFQLNGNSVFINVPRELKSGNYSFHVFTKNTSNVSSPTYTLTY